MIATRYYGFISSFTESEKSVWAALKLVNFTKKLLYFTYENIKTLF